MDYIQILAVHSRGVYNFIGIILEARFFSHFYAFFSKISLRFWPFSNPTVVEETSIEKALNANECVRWIEAFIANMGHPSWGSQSMQELASGIFIRVKDFRCTCKNRLHHCVPFIHKFAQHRHSVRSKQRRQQGIHMKVTFYYHFNVHVVLKSH